MTVDPALAAMAAKLAELAIPSAAATIYTKVETITKGRANEQTVTELRQVINDLIKERTDLVAIAQAYEQELAGQRLQDKDIQYIIDNVLPALGELVDNMPDGPSRDQADEALNYLEKLLSVEMLTVLQLVGFNYRQAIGEPLTFLIRRLITSRVPQDQHDVVEFRNLEAQFSIELAKISQDEAATDRWQRLRDFRAPRQ